MKAPLIVVNFKTYSEASGQRALEMARLHAKVAQETGVNIAIAVQAVDLRMVAQEVNIPVLAQHFDLAEQGPFTGHVTAHSLKETGVIGSLLNHSERRLGLDDIEETIDLARQQGLMTVVCADTAYSGKAVSELDPNFVAIEPPELIGGDVSVCTAKPQIITDSVAMIGAGKVLVGAGIKMKEDVQKVLEGGASGVLVASGVIKSLDPEKALYEMAEGVLQAR